MQKFTFVFFITILTSLSSICQITKHNWFIGGSGRISFQSQTRSSYNVKGLLVELSPYAGYFFIDKFAGGMRTKLVYTQVKAGGLTDKSDLIGVGPFLRYYFLDSENKVNVFAESSCQFLHYGIISGRIANEGSNTVTFSAGPVLYFNTSVGVEFTASYELYNVGRYFYYYNAKTFYLSIGLQIHLEKEKKM